MKKATRLILAFMLALAMTLTMGVSVFAAGESGSTEDGNATLGGDQNMVTKPSAGTPADISDSGVRQDGTDVVENNVSTHGEYTAVEETVRIYKEIVIFNTNSSDTLVYLPNITYTYAVAAADVADDKYITDEYKLSGNIRDGVADALKTSSATVTYSATNGITPTKTSPNNAYVITNQDGVAARGYIDIEFDQTKFSKPGVYRYVITETANDREKAGVSIDKDQYNDKRFLDVYVQNAADSTAANPTYEIYGYALFEGTKDDEFDAEDGPLIAKSNGFVSEKFDGEVDAYSRTEKDVDIYDTANIKIEKKVTGAMGDKTNEFPFEATIANSKITAPAKFSYQIVKVGGTLDTTSTSNPTKDLNATVKIGSATFAGADNLKLKDTEYVYIYGVPGKSNVDRSDGIKQVTTATVKEYNNTTDSYTVSAKYNDEGVTVTPAKMPASEIAAVADQDIVFTKTEEQMVVTNNMDSISPTNVVMRFGPFLFIFAAAILLLAVMRRRKARDAE